MNACIEEVLRGGGEDVREFRPATLCSTDSLGKSATQVRVQMLNLCRHPQLSQRDPLDPEVQRMRECAWLSPHPLTRRGQGMTCDVGYQ